MKTNSERLAAWVSIGVVFVGGVSWLTSLAFQTQANSDTLKKIETRQDDYTKSVQSIDERLAHIEGALGVKQKGD